MNQSQALKAWHDVRASLGRIEVVHWRGRPLSKQDSSTYLEALVLWGVLLYDLLSPYGIYSHRRCVQAVLTLGQADVAAVGDFLADAVVLWRRFANCEAVLEEDRAYDAFKGLARRHGLLGHVVSPLEEVFDRFDTDRDPTSFYLVSQTLSFLTHLTLEDIDMSQELIEGYMRDEERVRLHRVPEFLLHQMNQVMRDWLSDLVFDPDEFIPGHGPGGIAEAKGDTSLNTKYGLLRPDIVLEKCLWKNIGVHATDFCPVDGPEVTSRVSRTILVPKSLRTRRIISAEPATCAYFQQAAAGVLDRFIQHHAYLSTKIVLHDQTHQQALALYASWSRSLATVDLSAASDSVSCHVVERVFRGTALYPFLWATRSTHTRVPDGRTVRLAKFAPMGSALAFLVETLIFACIVECTYFYVRATDGACRRLYGVYGDDIIVPEEMVRPLLDNLRFTGFLVNSSKSFMGEGSFRESCGMEAYNGVDVSPVRISRKFSAREITSSNPEGFAGRIQLVNACDEFGLRTLRRYLLGILRGGTYKAMFSLWSRYGVVSPQPSNFHAKKRWNDDYQRDEFEVGCPEVRAVDDPQFSSFQFGRVEGRPSLAHDMGAIGLFEWHRRARHGDDHSAALEPPVSVDLRRTETRLRTHYRGVWGPPDLHGFVDEFQLHGRVRGIRLLSD